jgi:hypothetical protein
LNNEPVAWILFRDGGESYPEYTTSYKQMREWETYLGDNERIEPHYTHPAKTLTDEEIDSVIHELRQKSFDPKRWVDVYTVAIETIVELRDELSILKKAQEV